MSEKDKIIREASDYLEYTETQKGKPGEAMLTHIRDSVKAAENLEEANKLQGRLCQNSEQRYNQMTSMLYMKAVILLLDLICIFLSIRFILKMQQFGQDQIKYAAIRSAWENQYPEKEQNYNLDGLGKTGSFIQRYDEVRLAVEECRLAIWKYQHEYQTWESIYHAKLFIDARAAELYEDKEENPHIERYFHLEKDVISDFTNIEGYEVLSDAELEGEFLPVGEEIWLRYTGGNTLPFGLLIGNQEINIGYHGVRVGMEQHLTKEKIPEAVEGTVMTDGEMIGYLKCEDTHYEYYFFEEEGQISYIYIVQK